MKYFFDYTTLFRVNKTPKLSARCKTYFAFQPAKADIFIDEKYIIQNWRT